MTTKEEIDKIALDSEIEWGCESLPFFPQIFVSSSVESLVGRHPKIQNLQYNLRINI